MLSGTYSLLFLKKVAKNQEPPTPCASNYSLGLLTVMGEKRHFPNNNNNNPTAAEKAGAPSAPGRTKSADYSNDRDTSEIVSAAVLADTIAETCLDR